MTFTLGWPQIVWLALVLFGDVYAAVNHGKPRPVYNVWVSLLGTVISVTILYWGGFFS